MIYIYCRVSAQHQNVVQQADHLMAKYTNYDSLVCEKGSGKDLNRPRFDSMRKALRSQDTVIVQDLSRLGRNNIEVLIFLEECDKHQVKVIIDDLGVDTTTASGKLTLAVISAVNQAQREQMLEKQAIGIARARKEGKYKGRKAYSENMVNLALKMMNEGVTVNDVSKQLNIGSNTLYTWRREQSEE